MSEYSVIVYTFMRQGQDRPEWLHTSESAFPYRLPAIRLAPDTDRSSVTTQKAVRRMTACVYAVHPFSRITAWSLTRSAYTHEFAPDGNTSDISLLSHKKRSQVQRFALFFRTSRNEHSQYADPYQYMRPCPHPSHQLQPD